MVVRWPSFYVSHLKFHLVAMHLIKRFVFSCVLLHWLYSSNIIFPCLSSKDTRSISRSLKFLPSWGDLLKHLSFEPIIIQLTKAHQMFATRTRSDSFYSTDEHLAKCITFSVTHSNCTHLQAHTRAYKCSVVPFLNRVFEKNQNSNIFS